MTDESKEDGRGEGEGGEGSADLIRFLANELRNIKSGPITVMFTREPILLLHIILCMNYGKIIELMRFVDFLSSQSMSWNLSIDWWNRWKVLFPFWQPCHHSLIWCICRISTGYPPEGFTIFKPFQIPASPLSFLLCARSPFKLSSIPLSVSGKVQKGEIHEIPGSKIKVSDSVSKGKCADLNLSEFYCWNYHLQFIGTWMKSKKREHLYLDLDSIILIFSHPSGCCESSRSPVRAEM